jgi:predicted P-loop ATPase
MKKNQRPVSRLTPRGVSDEFARGSGNQIIATNLDNIRLALRRLNVHPTYNEFLNSVFLNDERLDDRNFNRLWIRIDDTYHFRPKKDLLESLILFEAEKSAFHPVRSYFDQLHWDGTPRLDAWLHIYGGAADTPYVRAIGSLVLIAAVRRVRQPGCKFDELLVLESKQGTLKSSALRALCPDESWFSDDLPLGVESKEVIERTSGKVIVEASEMVIRREKDTEVLKSFLSRRVDGPVRLAYGRLSTEVPRKFIIIATTNKTRSYLNDPSGARRFWPVVTQRFDIDSLLRDRDQIWAEAVFREAAGESIRLPEELWPDASREQEKRREEDPWEDTVGAVFDVPDFDDVRLIDYIPVERVWKALGSLGADASGRNNNHARRIEAIAARLGFEKTRLRIAGAPAPIRCWVRSSALPSLVGDAAEQ